MKDRQKLALALNKLQTAIVSLSTTIRTGVEGATLLPVVIHTSIADELDIRSVSIESVV